MVLPSGLPAPVDDGAARHLHGLKLPSHALAATDGLRVDLAALRGRTTVYIYPRTGVPGQALPDGWDLIPGARGCTPQSCAFRDLHGEFAERGVEVVGLSAQSPEEVTEFAERVQLPFPVLSDPSLELAEALGLPMFGVDGMTVYKRVTLVIRGGEIVKVFYPIFPPDRNAADILAWLTG
jgi:peroxiredoxin